MTKCACEMTAAEILGETVRIRQPARSILIEDVGHGWRVTQFGPETAGDPAPAEHVTIQSTLERVEALLVLLRRQKEITPSEVITDPLIIAKAIRG